MSCVKQSPILSRVRVGMTIPMEKSVTFARGALSKCLVTRSSLNGRISNRNAGEGAKRSFGYSLSVISYQLSVISYQLLVIGYLGNFAECPLFLFLISRLFLKAERQRMLCAIHGTWRSMRRSGAIGGS